MYVAGGNRPVAAALDLPYDQTISGHPGLAQRMQITKVSGGCGRGPPRGGRKMKTKLLALLLLAGSCAFAGTHFFFGVGVGPAYGYYAPPPPPPPPVVAYAPAPGPGYTWIAGYWHPAGPRWNWRAGYWAPRP